MQVLNSSVFAAGLEGLKAMEIGAKQYSRGPFMAAVFLLVFWILFSEP